MANTLGIETRTVLLRQKLMQCQGLDSNVNFGHGTLKNGPIFASLEKKVGVEAKHLAVNDTGVSSMPAIAPLVKPSAVPLANRGNGLDATVEVMGTAMDVVYIGSNGAIALSNALSSIRPMAAVIPVVGIIWNVFDALCGLWIAAKNKKDKDYYAMVWNIISSVQLLGLTSVIAASHALGSVTGGFGFAVAMAISWHLEWKAMKRCEQNIEDAMQGIGHLCPSMGTVIAFPGNDSAPNKNLSAHTLDDYYKAWKKAIKKGSKVEVAARERFEHALNRVEFNLSQTMYQAATTSSGRQLSAATDSGSSVSNQLLSVSSSMDQVNQASTLSLLKKVRKCKVQIKKRERHNKSRRAWKWCTFAMTVVAVAGVLTLSSVACVATCGVALGVAASVVAVGTGIYRMKCANKNKALEAQESRMAMQEQNRHRLFSQLSQNNGGVVQTFRQDFHRPLKSLCHASPSSSRH